MTILEEIESILKKLPKPYAVAFALHCAEDVYHLVDVKNKALVDECLELIRLWLRDIRRRPELELRLKALADQLYSGIMLLAWLESGEAPAAQAAVIRAAWATISSEVDWKMLAMEEARESAKAAAEASGNPDKKFQEYKEYLLGMVKEISRVEKLIWNLEEV